MTHVAEGWAFLVARGRHVGYRTVLAPGFLVDRGLQDLLAESTGVGRVGSDGTGMVEVDDAEVGRLGIGYTSERVSAADLEGAQSAGGDPLTDEHGRPLEIVYGFVSRDELDGPLHGDDLRSARAAALQSYRRFLSDEQGHRIDVSPGFALRTGGRLRTAGAAPPQEPPDAPPPDVERPGDPRPRWRKPGRGVGAVVIVALAAGGVGTSMLADGGSEAVAGPLTGSVPALPQSVMATDGRRHLVFELMLSNDTAARVRVDAVEVLAGARRIARYATSELAALMSRPPAGTQARTITAGSRRELFMDIRLAAGQSTPPGLEHRFALTVMSSDGAARRVTMTGARTRVERGRAPEVGMPLGGRNLLVADSLARGENRRAVTYAGGRPFLARRFAIDFQQLGERGARTFTGDPARNESYHVYGDPVVAVAAGPVVAARDGIPDSTPPRAPSAIAPGDVDGNAVVQDLGHGRVAVYAHLKPQSLRVKAGQRLRAGQVLGLVGNSGDSAQPRLHFRVMDRRGGASRLAAQGLAFAFTGFTLDGRVTRRDGAPARVEADPPRVRRGQHPLAGDLIGRL